MDGESCLEVFNDQYGVSCLEVGWSMINGGKL